MPSYLQQFLDKLKGTYTKTVQQAQPLFVDAKDVGNIDLNNRPQVKNPNGSISTVLSVSFNQDGKEVLVPKVMDNGTIVSDQEAWNNYLKTGKHLGKFSSEAEATAYAKQLHNQQAVGMGNSFIPRYKNYYLK